MVMGVMGRGGKGSCLIYRTRQDICKQQAKKEDALIDDVIG